MNMEDRVRRDSRTPSSAPRRDRWPGWASRPAWPAP